MFFAQDHVVDKSVRFFTEPYSVVTGDQPLRNDSGGSDKIPFTLAINPDPSAGGGITTMTNATSSISILDSALSKINTRRAYLGAVQNRLESALNEATNYSENLAASASQILDVDYAEESARMTRYQIMQQAGVAALGQAKAIPQSVVSLLS